MECLGVEPGVAWWKAQTNPLSYGGTPVIICLWHQLLVVLVKILIRKSSPDTHAPNYAIIFV